MSLQHFTKLARLEVFEDVRCLAEPMYEACLVQEELMDYNESTNRPELKAEADTSLSISSDAAAFKAPFPKCDDHRTGFPNCSVPVHVSC